MSDTLSNADQAERRLLADRPSPAIPLLVMAAVPLGAIVFALSWHQEAIASPSESGTGIGTVELVGPPAFGFDSWPGAIYWIAASAAAYVLITLIARRQGYRHGIWVSRMPLAVGGLVALAVALITTFGWWATGDLLIRGYLPMLAMAVAIIPWGLCEHLPALWAFGLVASAVALTGNLYDMENMLFRLGVPHLNAASDVVNLAVMAFVLLLGSAGFAFAYRSRPRHAPRGPQ